MAIESRRESAGIDRNRRRDEVEDPDVPVQIEGTLDLRQVVFPDRRLLVDQEQRDAGNTSVVDPAETGDRPESREADDRDDVHATRDQERSRDAESDGDRPQPVLAIEGEIL